MSIRCSPRRSHNTHAPGPLLFAPNALCPSNPRLGWTRVSRQFGTDPVAARCLRRQARLPAHGPIARGSTLVDPGTRYLFPAAKARRGCAGRGRGGRVGSGSRRRTTPRGPRLSDASDGIRLLAPSYPNEEFDPTPV